MVQDFTAKKLADKYLDQTWKDSFYQSKTYVQSIADEHPTSLPFILAKPAPTFPL